MSEEEMTAEDKKAVEALAKNVSEALANGVSQDEIVSQLLFCRRKVRVSISIVRCALAAMLLKSLLQLSSWNAIEAA